MSKSICTKCKVIFASVKGFDKHRVGNYGDPIYENREDGKRPGIIGYTKSERRCLTIPEMQAKGMTQNARGWWITEAFEGAAALREEDAAD